MKWTDDGIILSTRVFGESGRILTLLTPGHGRHAGLVRIPKTRSRLNIETGTFVEATWNARLSDHLGQWQLETVAAHGARLMPFPLPLTALGSACALTNEYLPERHPYPSLYTLLKQLIEDLAYTDNWRLPYINYELALLKDLGFGLDLSACAVTGQTDNLIYISPNTGRAVSEKAGEPYKNHLLPLPAYWLEENASSPLQAPEFQTSLQVTGFFLNRHLVSQHGLLHGLPLVRQRLVERVGQPA